MFRSCQCCDHPERAKLDAALRAGQQQKDIAAIYGISKAALSRHRNKHLDRPAPGDTLAFEADKWRQRADEIWHTASAAEDTRGQAQACAAGLRALTIASKHAAEEAAKAPPAESSCEIQLEFIDRLVAEANEREFSIARENARGSGQLDILQLFENMLDPDLKTAVLEFAADWLMERPKDYAKQGRLREQETVVAN